MEVATRTGYIKHDQRIYHQIEGRLTTQTKSDAVTGEATETGLVRREADALEDLRQAVIMMVDDETPNIEVTQADLEEAGYSRFVFQK